MKGISYKEKIQVEIPEEKILEHIAIHSTIDMRQTLRGKTHTLGRLYRKILLPLCYWVGKI